ncbi:MAG: ATPase domain-containing protein [Candidatus Nanoarchaeia archaeon]|nr:ATPase domain-containing protein [Candidatus Nanoarchaeia archaeon]MDD5740900.1 ATPase domain-containing protein [Candidatus Nanoarchaeia archaeon]
MQKIFTGKIDGEEIGEGDIVLIKVPSKKIVETNTNILKHYVSVKGYNIVYVTVNKPFSELIEGFKKIGIDTGKIFIIDAVTPRRMTNGNRSGNAVFIGSPKELTNISISTTSTVKELTGAKILIFDSVSTLLFHNDFGTVKDFIRFISNKMKELKVTFAMICIKDMTDEKMISQLSSFADKIIEIE